MFRVALESSDQVIVKLFKHKQEIFKLEMGRSITYGNRFSELFVTITNLIQEYPLFQSKVPTKESQWSFYRLVVVERLVLCSVSLPVPSFL